MSGCHDPSKTEEYRLFRLPFRMSDGHKKEAIRAPLAVILAPCQPLMSLMPVSSPDHSGASEKFTVLNTFCCSMYGRMRTFIEKEFRTISLPALVICEDPAGGSASLDET